MKIDFYQLSGTLEIKVEKYQKLFPNIKILDYTVGLTDTEIKLLKEEKMKND